MKRLIQLISLLLLISILLTSCATYNPAIDDGNLNDDVVGPDENPGEENPGEENPGEEEEGEKPYTVTLNVNGKDYKPNASGGPYYVQWSNGFSVHTAELINGKAEIYGLDDDYIQIHIADVVVVQLVVDDEVAAFALTAHFRSPLAVSSAMISP